MGAADFLFTPSVQRVLSATLAHPEKSFTLRELLSLAATGRGSTQQQIEKLLEAGVLQEEPRRGHQRSIRANKDFFLYPELSSIVRKSFGVREPLQRALEPFASEIQEAFVFGSVAKGTDTATSDIDLVVVGHVPLAELNEALDVTEQELRRPIHVSMYEPEEWQALVTSDPVVSQIAEGAKLMVVSNAAQTA
jgi:uncharacterized protein